MSNSVVLTFTSKLSTSPEQVWTWMTSVKRVSAELWPVLKMTTPPGVVRIDDVRVVTGERLFRSLVLLFGVLPIDRSDLTLVSIDPGRGLVEESPMFSMKLWRHERSIAADGDRTRLTDKLTFEPRFVPGITRWFIRKVFEHRHRVLRRELG